MRIGIGLAGGCDPERAAVLAARQAKAGVRRPVLALAFGGVGLDQKKVHRGLLRELDPAMLIGGSSYAEITPAGVTRDSVAVLLLELDGASASFADASVKGGQHLACERLARAIDPGPEGRRALGLMVTGYGELPQDDPAKALHERLGRVALFGAVASGDYDAGMKAARFWKNWQYAGPRLENWCSRLALLRLPPSVRVGFGFGHGWEPVGPAARVTRARRGEVFEVDGMSAVDYYRQFFGADAPREVLLRSIQRYGFAARADGDASVLKLPVQIDFRKGSITYEPAEELQGRQVQLIVATRGGLVEGARRAARAAMRALGGRRPSLVLAMSCCTRNALLNSRLELELEAAQKIFGAGVPVFGAYAGGELVPFESRYERAADLSLPCGGSYFHSGTIGFLALADGSAPRARLSRPESCGVDAMRLVERGESALDDTETFLANLNRKSVSDAERLRRQADVIRRYTPHGIWREIGSRAARGVYEVPDRAFEGAFFFMDVKGFTAYSETHAPAEVVAQLNRILGPAADVIHENGGDVDKFIGDCIFASFEDPAGAVEAGRRILESIEALSGPFTVRIGVNAGRAVRANVGSGGRREYTYIGDAVNLAQRLESNATPGAMLVSETVYRRVKADWPKAAKRRLTVKGKSAPVTAYELSV